MESEPYFSTAHTRTADDEKNIWVVHHGFCLSRARLSCCVICRLCGHSSEYAAILGHNYLHLLISAGDLSSFLLLCVLPIEDRITTPQKWPTRPGSNAKDTVILHMFTDQVWTEVARSTNSDYMKPLTADTTFTDTTLADVSQMSGMILKPATYYRILGYLKCISSAVSQDLKFALQTNNAFAEDHWTYVNTNEDGTTLSDSGTVTTGMIVDIVNAKVHGVMIQGMCLTHATLAPTVDFQAAQGTDAGTTTLEKGSWISFDEVSTK